MSISIFYFHVDHLFSNRNAIHQNDRKASWMVATAQHNPTKKKANRVVGESEKATSENVRVYEDESTVCQWRWQSLFGSGLISSLIQSKCTLDRAKPTDDKQSVSISCKMRVNLNSFALVFITCFSLVFIRLPTLQPSIWKIFFSSLLLLLLH